MDISCFLLTFILLFLLCLISKIFDKSSLFNYGIFPIVYNTLIVIGYLLAVYFSLDVIRNYEIESIIKIYFYY